VDVKIEKTALNIIDAAAQGAGDGLHLALNIGGMLIAFLALIAMVNAFWAGCTRCRDWAGFPRRSRDCSASCLRGGMDYGRAMEGCVVDWGSAGTRLVLNEFVAFLKLGR